LGGVAHSAQHLGGGEKQLVSTHGEGLAMMAAIPSRLPKELPPNYAGERHIATVGHDEDGNYRWGERPGRAPTNEDDGKLPPLRVIIM
jgi:hypothetical protein